MAITLRTVKGETLTYEEADRNFSSLFYSASISGSSISLHYTASAFSPSPNPVILTVPTSSGFPYTGSASISGSLTVVGPVSASQGFTGSLLGTATSASYIDLVQGPNITINKIGSRYEISGSAAGSGIQGIQGVQGVPSLNLQKKITGNYSVSNADNNYSILVENGASAINITVPSGLMSNIEVGFIQVGSGDITFVPSGTTINNPTGLKIKGQYYQAYLEQDGTTNVYYLLGNTKA